MLLERIKRYKEQKKGIGWIANKLGVAEAEVQTLLRGQGTNITICPAPFTATTEVNIEKGTLKSEVITDFEPKNDQELAELHKVDLTKYKITSYWTKQRGTQFTSSLHCALKGPTDYSQIDFENFLNGYTPPALSFTHSGGTDWVDNEEVDVELSIADFHLAKKTLEGESLEDKVEHYKQTVLSLLNKIDRNFKIRTIVFPISNDFFHTDNYQNQTTAGTPQDVLTGFDNEYEIGFDLLATVIRTLAGLSQHVHVVLVQGNHDRTKSFYLAHGLAVLFKNQGNITFDRENSVTKSVVLGNTFIGYHHGNCKIDQLPLLFSTGKGSEEFGKAKYREVHTGDKHHYMAKEIMGCRIQQMPSLSGTDRWHEDNNFVHNVRAGLALVYDKQLGKIAEFESRI